MKKKIKKMGLLLIISVLFTASMGYTMTADISIENAYISGGYFYWEIHITPTDNWGSTWRKALGNCSWYFDANLDALDENNIELTYEAPYVTTQTGGATYTNSCGTISHMGKLYAQTLMDNTQHDPASANELPQGTNCHLYTVRVPITNPSAESDLYWDGLNTGIFNAQIATVTTTNLGNGDITLPVELSTFTAQFVNGVPTLYWKTESETDNIGWNVYRNTEEEFQSATQINNDLIQGYGTTTEPHSYIYEDEIEDAMPGDMYWYWIQSIDFGGQFHTYQRAVSIEILDPNDPGIVEPPVLYGIKNTPNPFNSYTQIHYTLSESAIVEISIYNILGKLVRTLPRDLAVQDGEAYIGTSYWDGKDENGIEQETGIYLYQLKVNGKTYETKRLTVIR